MTDDEAVEPVGPDEPTAEQPAQPSDEPSDDAGDAQDESDEKDENDEKWERPIDRFRRGAAGSVIAAGLLGVRDALEGRPEKDEPAIVSEAPEPRLDHIDLVLDPEHPERSRAVVYLPPRDDDHN